jgi:NADH-quinone oxidoreductase subunit L
MNTANTDLCKLALVILILPLVGFTIQIFFSRKIPPRGRQGDWVPTLAMLGGLAISCYMVFLMFSSPSGIEAQRWYPLGSQAWTAIGPEAVQQAGPGRPPAAGFRLDFGIEVDNLTVVMLFVVTLVSFLVHLYSMGYMHGEVRYNRFFAFLGLFSFSMLGLCITSNLLYLFMFWELVGLCSYFLIGFYFEKKSAQNASIKAFMTTRIGDLGFFLAILIIASQVRSLEFQDIFASVRAGSWEPWLLTFTGLALFLGPIGKSGQFPLHVWLPDAMEGPTPVSALIHAATMVAAGVYLVGRMFPFLAGAPYFQGDFAASDALFVIALTGAFTAIFAASIAFAQTDIKKILAYSTVSQLGYMMLGLGMGSVSAGLFHLTTHAFFKALLFLGSGSVIHAVHSNELSAMGGLRKKMPITWVTFGIATLAIAGLPCLSGFYSKEAILGQALAFAHHNHEVSHRYPQWLAHLPFILGATTAGMTAFYMFRLFFSTFHGHPRDEHRFEHAHESPWTMTVPLSILAVLSVAAGGLGLPGFDSHWFEQRVSSTVLVPPAALEPFHKLSELAEHAHHTVLYLSVGLFALGVGLASLFFLPFGPFYRKQVIAAGTPLGWIHYCLKNLWFIDRLWTWLALHFVHVGQVVCGLFDKRVVDGFVNFWGTACRFVLAVAGAVDYHGVDGTVRGIGELSLEAGQRLRRLQSGLLQQYVYASVLLFAGVFLAAAVIVLCSLGSVQQVLTLLFP